MTMLTTFAPPARQTVIRAGLLASEGGMSRLSDGYLLLALAESQPLTQPVDLGVTADMVRAQLKAQARRRHDRELLATVLVRVEFLLLHDAEVERVGRPLLASTHDPDRAAEITWLVAYSAMRTLRPADATSMIRFFSITMSTMGTSFLITAIASGRLRSSTIDCLPTLSWPNIVLAPSRTTGRERIRSPSVDSTLITSAPRSAIRRLQCGPAIVVEKSRIRTPLSGLGL